MWIVNVALRRPYTFIVAALLIVLNPSDLLQEGESVSVRHIAAGDKKQIS